MQRSIFLILISDTYPIDPKYFKLEIQRNLYLETNKFYNYRDVVEGDGHGRN